MLGKSFLIGLFLVAYVLEPAEAWSQSPDTQRPAPAEASASIVAQPTREEAVEVMHRAVGFFRQHAAASGGYVFQLSEDLASREGEGKVGRQTAWIEPPATPAVALAYLGAFRLTRDPMLLEAARETADALLRGQLLSGGWDNKIEFAAAERKRYAYRVDGGSGKGRRNTTTFDDDKSQSVIRFLMQLDEQLEFQDRRLHEAVVYAMEAVLKSQFPGGAWPQRYNGPQRDEGPQRDDGLPATGGNAFLRATLPHRWSRDYPGKKYGDHYTLNDDTQSDLIITALDAWQIYGDSRYLEAAQRGGDFLVRAQLPEPQPGWAQQYDHDMHPAWARKFEPPAITGGESQGVMRTLILLYRRTADVSEKADRFLEPIPRAVRYYRRSLLDDGRLARFYELGTNRPLFFTKDYRLTYSPDDVPTHYAFIVGSALDEIDAELSRVRKTPAGQLWKRPAVGQPKPTLSLAKKTQAVIGSLDARGAWVEAGRLRYHGEHDSTRRVIRSDTFIRNLNRLAHWIAAIEDRNEEPAGSAKPGG